MDDFLDATTIEECIEMATVDCYGEYEQINGWYNALDDVLQGVKKAKLLGTQVKFIKVDMLGDVTLIAVVEKNKKRAKVTLDSLEFLEIDESQQLWLDAWSEWAHPSFQ